MSVLIVFGLFLIFLAILFPKQMRWLVICFVGFVVLAVMLPLEKSHDAPVAAPAGSRSCKNVWSLCADNEDWLNNNSDVSAAQSACKTAAADKANYGEPQWPWLAFSSAQSGADYIKTGRAILFEEDVKFQNGFGAYQRMKVICTYNLINARVERVIVSPR